VFGIGGTEFFIIAIFVLLIFGPDKLPEMGRTIGKWTKEFRRAQESMQTQIKAEMDGLERATNPFYEEKDGDKKATTGGENEFEAQARKAREVDPEWDEEEEEPE
jgi:TatA/E family protein of Tat protein translocase